MDPAPTLSQSAEFEAALRLFGRSVVRQGPVLVLSRRIVGVPVSMASRVYIAPGDDPARLARGPLLLAPDHPAPWLAGLGAMPLVTPVTVAELDLAASPDILRARQGAKWRNRLVRAEASGLRVRHQPMPRDPNHPLLRADARQQKARGYRNWPPALTAAWAAATPGAAHLFTAQMAGGTVAQMLFLTHGRAVTYHVGHTGPEGRARSAHTLLLWRAATWFAGNGYLRLDLGPLDTEAAPGLARFKLGSGARARALGGTWGWWRPLSRCLGPRICTPWTDPGPGGYLSPQRIGAKGRTSCDWHKHGP